MPIAKSVEDTVLGEAKAGNYEDMLGIVSVIDNRARQTKTTYNDVVSARGQFDAFGKALPAGVGKYRDMARQAIAEVKAQAVDLAMDAAKRILTSDVTGKKADAMVDAAIKELDGKLH